MEFMPAGELLGATTRVRTLTIRGAPSLPDGSYSLLDCYCTDPACDCRKTMIQVHHERRFVSMISFGWESAAYYSTWYGAPCDEQTIREMQGPSIDISSPDRVPRQAMLAFFTSILDDDYRQHFRVQYIRFKTALQAPGSARILNAARARIAGSSNRRRNEPCSCGSGRKFKICCGRGI